MPVTDTLSTDTPASETFSISKYEHQLDEKLATLNREFADLQLPQIEIFRSPVKNFRMRAEFKMWHTGNIVNYAMFTTDGQRKLYLLEDFPIGSEIINHLMPQLHNAINADQNLRQKLFQLEFLTTLSGQALVTLIYHKPLTEAWIAAAQTLKNKLMINLVGRSKKQKIVVGDDYVIEELRVGDRRYRYQQVEASFTQPNAEVCESMLTWAVDKSRGFDGDLLELYCGNGNFTLPLAQNFNRVLATEVAKTSVNSALYNLELNHVENVVIARMSSEEFTQALDKVRAFNRLKDIDLDSYKFSTIFVDPPRSGLDINTLALTQGFENIIYISCNPNSLYANLKTLVETHEITHFAVFDQFPYTYHLECGVVLRRR